MCARARVCVLETGDPRRVCRRGPSTLCSNSGLLGPQEPETCEKDPNVVHPYADHTFMSWSHQSICPPVLFAGTEVRLALSVVFEVALRFVACQMLLVVSA